jgi:arsenate reductase-like glutaredoxin family protein
MRVSYIARVELREIINKSYETSRPIISAKTKSFMNLNKDIKEIVTSSASTAKQGGHKFKGKEESEYC